MLTIGLIGGMSWESTAVYYRHLNEAVRDRLGGLHSARVVLASVDFAEIAAMQTENRWADAGAHLAARARELQAAGADFLLIAANTMHKVVDTVQAAVDVEVLHVADCTAAAVRDAGLGTVALLGTAYTMEQPFLRERLAGHGLTVLVPEPDDRAEVHRIIYDELCRGIFTDTARRTVLDLIDRLAGQGAAGVVLGCTELELLIDDDTATAVPVFPTARLHALAAVTRALG